MILLLKLPLKRLNMGNPPFARIKALELLAKYHGLLIERQEIGKPGEFDKLTRQRLNSCLNLLLDRRPASG